MTVSYTTATRIVQFAYFVPALAASLWLCYKQGLKVAAASWRFIAILALLRMAGDIAYFISLSSPTTGGFIAIVICDLMGLAPLTLACVGLLGRVNGTLRVLPAQFFNFISLVSLIGLITGIWGATSAVDTKNDQVTYTINNTIKAALGLFIATYLLMVSTLAILCYKGYESPQSRRTLGREKNLLVAVAVSSPILLVRLIYACMADFGSDPRFQFIGGDDTVYLCMGVLVEIIVTTACLVAGFLVPPPPPNKETEDLQSEVFVQIDSRA